MSGKEEEREESTGGPSAPKHRKKTATINIYRELHARWVSMKKAHLMKYLLDTFEKGIAESPKKKSSTPAKPGSARSLFAAPVTPIASRPAFSSDAEETVSVMEEDLFIADDDSEEADAVPLGNQPADNSVLITVDGAAIEVEVDEERDEGNLLNFDVCDGDQEFLENDESKHIADLELSLADDDVSPAAPPDMSSSTGDVLNSMAADDIVLDDDCSKKTRLLDAGYEWEFLKRQNISQTGPEVVLSGEQRLIVDKSAIIELFGVKCRQGSCQEVVTYREQLIGCTLVMRWRCSAGHMGVWQSSAEFSNTYAINIILPSAIFISGNNYSKVSQLFKAMGIPHISLSTYHRVQNMCTLPGVSQWHEMMQDDMFTKLNEDETIPRVISGDGRNDSPGHSAQYCSYTFMIDNLHYVLHTELIDKRMTRLRSPNMELEGLVRGLDFLKQALKVVQEDGSIRKIELVTDAHPQIICKLADPSYACWVLHQMDIWHKAHRIGSKVLEAAKRKDCHDLNEWVSAIRNHFWHCAESCDGDEKVLQTKWQSVLYHVQGIHEWYEGKCSHGPISDHEHTPINPESPAIDALRSVVKDKTLNNSLRFYTHFRHTGRLENFHQVVLAYCPKRISFDDLILEANTWLLGNRKIRILTCETVTWMSSTCTPSKSPYSTNGVMLTRNKACNGKTNFLRGLRIWYFNNTEDINTRQIRYTDFIPDHCETTSQLISRMNHCLQGCSSDKVLNVETLLVKAEGNDVNTRKTSWREYAWKKKIFVFVLRVFHIQESETHTDMGIRDFFPVINVDHCDSVMKLMDQMSQWLQTAQDELTVINVQTITTTVKIECHADKLESTRYEEAPLTPSDLIWSYTFLRVAYCRRKPHTPYVTCQTFSPYSYRTRGRDVTNRTDSIQQLIYTINSWITHRDMWDSIINVSTVAVPLNAGILSEKNGESTIYISEPELEISHQNLLVQIRVFLGSNLEDNDLESMEVTPLIQEKRSQRNRPLLPQEKDGQRRCVVACLVTLILVGVGVLVFIMAIR